MFMDYSQLFWPEPRRKLVLHSLVPIDTIAPEPCALVRKHYSALAQLWRYEIGAKTNEVAALDVALEQY